MWALIWIDVLKSLKLDWISRCDNNSHTKVFEGYYLLLCYAEVFCNVNRDINQYCCNGNLAISTIDQKF